MSAAHPASISPSPPSRPSRPRSKRKIVLWTLLILFLAAILWAATSSNPLAQAIQELAGAKHDQPIVDTPFSLSPHNFRYYKFTLPDGSTNVAIVGNFEAADASAPADRGNSKGIDPAIEVFVLSEAGFAIWQRGYATNSLYDSGKVRQATFQQDLPAGAGVYYLVFSNRDDPKAAKKITPTAFLRYRNWFPDWFRRMRNNLRD